MKKDREPKGDLPVEPDKEEKESRTVPLPPDPADIVPVPVAMSAAEIDERAKVVESLREREEGRGKREEGG